MGLFVPRGSWHDRRCVSVILVGLLAIVQIAGAPTSIGAANPVTAQRAIVRTETRLGRTDVQKRITIAISLAPLVNHQEMDDFLVQLTDPKSPSYQHYLTPQGFTAKFLDPAARAQSADFLKNNGLTVTDTGVGSVIDATGTVGQVERAFAVTLSDYRDASGKMFYANDKTPALPTALAPHITAVLGLDSASVVYSHIAKPTNPTPHAVAPNTATGCAGATGVGAYTPNQFATAFDFDALYAEGFRGEGQTVAVIEFSDWSTADSDTYKACFGSTTSVNRVNVDGGTTVDPDGQGEVNLDVDVILGMLPKLAALNVYVSSGTGAAYIDTYQAMATDNTATMLSTSWGGCEFLDGTPNATETAENTIFFQMATQGQQIFAASGDDGADDCQRQTTPPTTNLSTDDPASQPYVVAVGGTTVTINGASNAYVSETVWNHSGFGTGGGLSQHWARPSWQTGPGTTNTYSNGKREVPDIAAPGDPDTGYITFNGGAWGVVGGTSGSAPFLAAGFALVNQAYVAREGRRIGFTSPSLYRLLAHNVDALRDVTVGNNCSQAAGECVTAGGIYPATPAFDLTTGVGTPKFTAIAAALIPPNSLPAPQPTASPVSGGNPLPKSRPAGQPVVGAVPAPLPSPRP